MISPYVIIVAETVKAKGKFPEDAGETVLGNVIHALLNVHPVRKIAQYDTAVGETVLWGVVGGVQWAEDFFIFYKILVHLFFLIFLNNIIP